MAENTYFKDELNFLFEARERAAEDFPDIARFLAIRDSDPDVERLFEGFAFLTGRLRQKLDDEFPELIHSMLAFWWPHYLRLVPSMSILEFEPVSAAFSESKVIEEGTEVQSKRLDSGERCRFRTTRPMIIHPLTLTDFEYVDIGVGTSLVMEMSVWPNAAFTFSFGDTLTLYLDGKNESACDLYHCLFEQVEAISLEVIKEDEVCANLTLDSSSIIPSGFNNDESVIPNSEFIAPGYLTAQEFFCFPEKFRFIELKDMQRIAAAIEKHKADRIRLSVRFAEQVPWGTGDPGHDIKLNCVPIINLFKGSARPILLDHSREEYRVIPESTKSMFCELYCMDEVVAQGSGYAEPTPLYAFESFDHVTEVEQRSFYRLKTSPKMAGEGLRTTISFVDRNSEHFGDAGDVISLNVWCCNGDQPKLIDPGEINVSTSSSPEFARFNNLTRPTNRLLPPLDNEMLWRLVSNMSMNFNTLLQDDSLRTVLASYDFAGFNNDPARRRTARILRSLRIEESGPADQLLRGVPVRGIASVLSVSRKEFLSLGEVYMFGCVLNEFFSAFAGVNSFHKLTLLERDSGEEFAWPVNRGSAQIL